jgi:cysteinyl-tRNA synthetase
MSKSLGNIITPAELLAQGHRGETLRLALCSRPRSAALALIELASSSAISRVSASGVLRSSESASVTPSSGSPGCASPAAR